MEFLEVPLFDDDLYKLLVRFGINLLVVLLLVVICYRPNAKDVSFAFPLILLNVMVFFICFAMKKLELELGMALGLFAIFAIIRYRTDTVPVKEMTYLFVVVGVAVINALSNKKTSYAELAATDLMIIGVAWLLEKITTTVKSFRKQSIVYDKLELLAPSQREALFQDIHQRTGLMPEDLKISKIDLQKGSASLTVYYIPEDS